MEALTIESRMKGQDNNVSVREKEERLYVLMLIFFWIS